MRQPLHGTVVALRCKGQWRGVMICGPSGAGKSDLALRLMTMGARLGQQRLHLCPRAPDDFGQDRGAGCGNFACIAAGLCTPQLDCSGSAGNAGTPAGSTVYRTRRGACTVNGIAPATPFGAPCGRICSRGPLNTAVFVLRKQVRKPVRHHRITAVFAEQARLGCLVMPS